MGRWKEGISVGFDGDNVMRLTKQVNAYNQRQLDPFPLRSAINSRAERATQRCHDNAR